MENDHRNSGFSHWTWLFSIAMLNYQRVPFPHSFSFSLLLSLSPIFLRWEGASRAKTSISTPTKEMIHPPQTSIYKCFSTQKHVFYIVDFPLNKPPFTVDFPLKSSICSWFSPQNLGFHSWFSIQTPRFFPLKNHHCPLKKKDF